MFITIEGIDGSGKSTQTKLFIDYLQKNNFNFIQTREPGGCELAENIREILLNKNNQLSDMTELLLMISARSEHYQKIIKPALLDGKFVICDRFIDSTVAYQGYARGLDIKTINFLNDLATENKKPDLTFYFDIDPEIAFKRLNNNLDRFEKEGIAFQQKVRQGFLSLSNSAPARIKIIPTTNLNIQSIHNKTLEIFTAFSKKFSK
jgi:dTMP kinase